jgi:L-fucose mutarotase/ribose pyranase (RbsD/FucU family)
MREVDKEKLESDQPSKLNDADVAPVILKAIVQLTDSSDRKDETIKKIESMSVPKQVDLAHTMLRAIVAMVEFPDTHAEQLERLERMKLYKRNKEKTNK